MSRRRLSIDKIAWRSHDTNSKLVACEVASYKKVLKIGAFPTLWKHYLSTARHLGLFLSIIGHIMSARHLGLVPKKFHVP